MVAVLALVVFILLRNPLGLDMWGRTAEFIPPYSVMLNTGIKASWILE